MVWLKRNLWLVVGGVAALLMAGWGGWYVYDSLGQNAELNTKLQEAKQELERVANLSPTPNQNNVSAAGVETRRANDAMAAAFRVFPSALTNRVDRQKFSSLLATTTANLRKLALTNRVELPSTDGYAFSFDALVTQVKFSDEELRLLTQQLAEIKEMVTVLCEARVDVLESVKRAPACESDKPSPDSPILPKPFRTNEVNGAIEWFYEVSFLSFTPQMAQVIEGLGRSRLGVVVKSVAVSPGEIVTGGVPPPDVGTPPPPPPPPLRFGRGARGPAAVAEPPRQNLGTVLDERRVRTVLLLSVVKPAP